MYLKLSLKGNVEYEIATQWSNNENYFFKFSPSCLLNYAPDASNQLKLPLQDNSGLYIPGVLDGFYETWMH